MPCCKSITAVVDASLDPGFIFDSKGNVLHKNHRAQGVFESDQGNDTRTTVSEFFLFTGEEGSWVDVVHGLKDAPEEFDAQAFTRAGDALEATVSLAKLPGCKCCTDRVTHTYSYVCCFVRDLTPQKLGELKLRCMIESSFDAMFAINEKGIIQVVNEAATKVFGWTRSEFMGSNISMICGERHGANHDRYMSRYLATDERRVMGKERELVAKKKDGSELMIQLGLTELKMTNNEHLFMGFVKDLTKLKLAEARIQRKQDMTNGLINSSFDPMFQINQEGIIQLVNQAAMDHFGWTREEFIGSNISMICAGKHGRDHDKYLKHYLETGERRVMGRRRQVMAVRKDGSEYPIELGITEVDMGSGEKSWCGFVRDVRREKFDEQELKEKEKLTSAIVESLSEALLTIDEHGAIYSANAAASQKLGWSKDAFVGQNLNVIFGTEFATKNVPDITSFIRNTSARGREIEVEARKKCGTLHPLFLSVVEVKGPFPILLGLDKDNEETEKGTRLFAAFLRSAEDKAEPRNASLMDSLMGSIGSLGSEATG